MTVRCFDCAAFSVKRAKQEWANTGYGCCEHREAWLMYSAEIKRDCGRFSPASEDVLQARKRWIAGVRNA